MIESIFFNPWIWIVAVLLVAAVGFGGILIVRGARLKAQEKSMYGSDGEGQIIAGIGVGILALILAGIYFGFMLPPYDTSFYQTYRITGEVIQIESAFSGDEGSMSQVFIAKVDGVDLFIKSDDQRFRTISVGDDVNLVCGKSFAYFQEPWFDCAIGGTP